MIACPDSSRLEALIGQDLPVAEAQEIEDHISSCSSCESQLISLIDNSESDWESWRELLSADTNADKASETISEFAKSDLIQELESAGFENIEEVGKGGMGIVFKAYQRELNREVAVKTLGAGLLAGTQYVQRLLAEASAVGQLNHPNITRIHQVSRGKMPYLVLEYVQDGDLAKRLRRGVLETSDAVDVAIQICSAVGHAHENGVLHRDIKPGNILFEGRTVKIVDFGLAKRADAGENLTGSLVVGTPSYMSPEQASGQSVDETSDVYSIGVVLYEMLCGKPPFVSHSPLESLRLIQSQEPVAPRKLQPNVPRSLDTICLKCLEKDPQRRYSSASELLEDLERFKNGIPIKAQPASYFYRGWRWCRRNPAATISLAVVAVAVVTVITLWAQFTADLSWQRYVALQKANEAQRNLENQVEANQATGEVLKFLTESLLQAAIPEKEGKEVTVVELLRAASATIDRDYEKNPRIEAPIRAALGATYFELGLPLEASPHLEQAVALYGELDDAAHIEASVNAALDWAICLKALDRGEESKEILEEMQLFANSEQLLRIRFHKLDFDLRERDLDHAEKVMLELYEDCQQELGEKAPLTLSVLGQIGVWQVHNQEYERGLETFTNQFEMQLEAFGEGHPDTLIAMNNIAISLVRLGRIEEAEPWHERGCEVREKALGPNHVSTLKAKHNLSMTQWRLGKQDAATQTLEQVCFGKVETYGQDHPQTMDSLYQLARMLLQMKAYERGLDICDEILFPVLGTARRDGHLASLLCAYAQLQYYNERLVDAAATISQAEELLSDESIANPGRLAYLQKTRELIAK